MSLAAPNLFSTCPSGPWREWDEVRQGLRRLAHAWTRKPTLEELASVHVHASAFAARPVRLRSGRAAVVAVFPYASKETTEVRARLLVEDAEGLPAGTDLTLHQVPTADDVVDMLALQAEVGLAAWKDLPDLTRPFGIPETVFGVHRGSPLSNWLGEVPAAFAAYLSDLLRRRLDRAVERSRLTPAFRTAMSAEGLSRSRDDKLYADRSREGHRRRAFFVSYPLIASDIKLSALRCAGEASRGSWRRRRDGRTPAHLRRLGGHTVTGWVDAVPVGAPRDERVRAMLDLACAVPVDWMPRDRPQTEAFVRAARFLPPMAVHSRRPVKQLVSSCKGDWVRFMASFERRPDHPRMYELLSRPVDHLAKRLLVPLAGDLVGARLGPDGKVVRSDTYAVGMAMQRLAGRILYRDRALSGVVEVAERWHRTLPYIDLTLPCGTDLDPRWPALFEPVTAFNGLRLVSLDGMGALFDEGRRGPGRDGVAGLAHCVGASRSSAQGGFVYYVSVRRPLPGGSYERLSTVSLYLNGSPETFHVLQHRGHGNALPPNGCREAVEWLLSEVPLASWRECHPCPLGTRGGDEIVRECGYDWRRPDLVEEAVRAYAPGLPRHLRGLTAAGLRRELGLDELVVRAKSDRRHPFEHDF